MVTEYTPKTFIPRKFFLNFGSSLVTKKRTSKIDQIESRSISCVGGTNSYAYISRFCAIVDYFSSVKIGVAIKLVGYE